MYYLLVFIPLFLSACAGVGDAKSGDFYTWVDERGQLHTIKREPKESESKEVNKPNFNQKTKGEYSTRVEPFKKGLVDIDESEFTPSTEIDNRIKGKKLYAWNDGVSQNIEEVSLASPEVMEATSKPLNNSFIKKNFYLFREGKELFLSELLGRQTKLDRIYSFNQATQSDYALLELDLEPGLTQLGLKTFVTKERVAMPLIVFLDKNYQSVSAQFLPFQDYTDESWSSYAYFSGHVFIPPSAHYLLITPNKEAGVAEVGEKIIKMVDLGSILIDL